MPYREGKRWRATPQHKGLRLKTRLFDRKADATEYEREEKRKAREWSLLPRLDLLTFSAKYLIHAEQRFPKKTLRSKKALIERIIREFGESRDVDSITTEEIQTYLSDQARARSNDAANRDRNHLLALWSFGRKILKIAFSPVAGISRMPHDRKVQYTPSTNDVLKVLAVADRKERVFLDCYLQTAARRSEIFRWQWNEDINFERREYRLGTRKTRDGSMSYEWFPMSGDLYDGLWWLWQNRRWKDNPWVWPVEHPGPGFRKPYTQRRIFLADLCRRAGVKYFGYHALRRYVASVLADTHKVSAKTIQRILRHSALSTTERYIHNLNTDLKATMDLLSEKNYTPALHMERKRPGKKAG